MKKKSLAGLLAGLLMFGVMCSAVHGSVIIINFDSIPGMANISNSSVPLVSQLSGGYLSSGVSFSSLANYVAVVKHSPTVSLPNIIGGVKANGVLSYDCPINISFFDPSNHTILAVTDFVSIRGDQIPLSGATATL